MIKNSRFILAACAAYLLPFNLPGQGHDEHNGVFHHLEHAIHALKELGKSEQAQELSGFARRLRRSMGGEREPGRERGRKRARDRGPETERKAAQHHLEIFRYAKSAFAESGKRDALDLIERAMHARELILEGRRDKEARQIIERRPSWRTEVELLQVASKVLKEYRADEKAGATAELAQYISYRHRNEGKNRKEGNKEKRRLTERQVAEQQLEILRYAHRVLAEAGRPDAADSLENMAKVLKYRLGGKKTEKGQALVKRSPSRQATSTHLLMAAAVLSKQGNKRQAEMVMKTAEQFVPRKSRERDVERKEKRGEKRKLTERQVAGQQLEILMYASKVLAEAGRSDAARSLSTMAKVMKSRLGGKKTEKGQKLAKRTPSRKATSAHLRMAAEVLAKQGNNRHAEMVIKTANQFAPRERREREGNRERDVKREREHRRQDEEREHQRREEANARERRRSHEHNEEHEEEGHDELHHHFEHLAERLERLERIVDELKRELQGLKRRRSR